MRIKHEHLKRLRVQAGWTQEEVSARCKIDVRTYRKYERGEVNKGLSGLEAFNRSDQYDVLDRIAATFGLSGPEELIELEPGSLPGGTQTDAQVPLGPGSPYHPAWYVHRDAAERKALNRLRSAGAPVVLQGPWLFGKATLLGHLLRQVGHEGSEGSSGPALTATGVPALTQPGAPVLPQSGMVTGPMPSQVTGPLVAGSGSGSGSGPTPGMGARVVRIDLYDLDDTCFVTLDALLRTIGGRILGGLGVPKADAALAEIWKSPASEKQKLGALFKRHAPPPGQRLYLAIERADRLQGLSVMNDFFALLRGWAEAGMEEPWSRLRLLVTVATEPTLLEDTDHSSFFALANPIRLGDLDRAQLAQLAALHHLDPAPSPDELTAMMALLAGHPYLCRIALYEAMISEISLSSVLAGVDWTGGVFAQHLSQLHSWVRQSGLLDMVGRVLDAGRGLPFLDYCKLYSKGLVVETARGEYRMRCKLYEDYFRAVWAKAAGAV